MRQTVKDVLASLTAAKRSRHILAGGENGLGLGYDIFRELDNGEVLWIGCAASLEDARSQIMVLGSRRPSCYFVRSASTGEIIAKFDRKNSGEACA